MTPRITTSTQTTTEIPNPDLCQNNQDCHQEAGCDYDYEQRRYLCKCHEFFVGDGITNCVPGPGKLTFRPFLCINLFIQFSKKCFTSVLQEKARAHLYIYSVNDINRSKQASVAQSASAFGC